MMVMEMSGENPVFSLESDEKPSKNVGDIVKINAKIVKKSEYAKEDGKICYVCEYEVQDVDGKTESKEKEEDYEGDDMEEIGKVIDEEMSKSKGNEETEDEE